MTATEVWLYGSSARGDRDISSDVDVLVVGDGDLDVATLGLPSRDRISVTRYTWPEIDHMASYGSLFLHHVRLEGKPLLESHERRMHTVLSSIGSYARAQQELACFRQVLMDVEDALAGDHSPAFEMSVVATAARHAAILGCYLLGEPDFGRTSAFRRLLPRLGYSTEFIGTVCELYAHRQAENEGRPIAEMPSTDDVAQWVARTRRIIDQVEELAY